MTPAYLYQTIHLSAGAPRLVAEHVAALDAASRTLFARPYTPNLHQLAARIAAVADKEHYPPCVSGFVRLQLSSEGEEQLLPAGISLYTGYALRSLTPDATVIAYENPISDAPSSAREAAAILAQQVAQSRGFGVAARCNNEGVLFTADDAPLFALLGSTLLTSPAPQSVERDLALRAIHATHMKLREESVLVENLRTYDELFFVDHRGVTALAHCDKQPYMALYAERVATAMESLFTSRN